MRRPDRWIIHDARRSTAGEPGQTDADDVRTVLRICARVDDLVRVPQEGRILPERDLTGGRSVDRAGIDRRSVWPSLTLKTSCAPTGSENPDGKGVGSGRAVSVSDAAGAGEPVVAIGVAVSTGRTIVWSGRGSRSR